MDTLHAVPLKVQHLSDVDDTATSASSEKNQELKSRSTRVFGRANLPIAFPYSYSKSQDLNYVVALAWIAQAHWRVRCKSRTRVS